MDQPYLDFPFAIDGRGRTAMTGEDDHLRDLISEVLFTSPGERVNRPDFGCGLKNLVFLPNSQPLAAATQTRIESLSDVPTVAESGYKDFELDNWFGVVAPATRARGDVRQAIARRAATPAALHRASRHRVTPPTPQPSRRPCSGGRRAEARRWTAADR